MMTRLTLWWRLIILNYLHQKNSKHAHFSVLQQLSSVAMGLGVGLSANKRTVAPADQVTDTTPQDSTTPAPPTHFPTLWLSPSTSPSESFLPTEKVCYWVDITVQFYHNPYDSSWDIQKLNDSGENLVIKVYNATESDRITEESICLVDGMYQFTTYPKQSNACNVTSDGYTIVQCGSYGSGLLSTRFPIPFVPLPSMSPSSIPTMTPSFSLSPSVDPTSSLMPSASVSPTVTCHWIQISIVYDLRPWFISWELQRVDSMGDNMRMKLYRENGRNARSYSNSLCLQEGEYEFTIYDHYGDGLCCGIGEGHYSVTSNGALIAQGNEFGYVESTLFSIPFTPYPSMSPSPTTTPSSSLSPSKSLSPTAIPSFSTSPSTSPGPSMLPSSSTQPAPVPTPFPTYDKILSSFPRFPQHLIQQQCQAYHHSQLQQNKQKHLLSGQPIYLASI